MSVPSIPTTYTHKLQPTAPFDIDLDTNLGGSFESKLAGGFDVKHSGSFETNLSGGLKTDNVLQFKGDEKQPVFTDFFMLDNFTQYLPLFSSIYH